ncbi:MAG: hypothetical protein ABSD81_06760 [Methanomicrobiales archaeon]|jgi:hypothetical protein
MTIAMILKINDGVILATDSASSLISKDPASGQMLVYNVYDNANKIFNLRKDLPIGAVTWGIGSIGNASIETLVKDFRAEISQKIDKDNYSLKDVIEEFKNFIFGRHYEKEFRGVEDPNTLLGFLIGGYSIEKSLKSQNPEIWRLEMVNGTCVPPINCCPNNEVGILWGGQTNPLIRIYNGYDPRIGDVLKEVGIEEDKIKTILSLIEQRFNMKFVVASMPIQDAINLAEYFVDLTEKFFKYASGATTVGGPIELAAITKHEGFKWVRRKHYYLRELNPQIIPIGERK